MNDLRDNWFGFERLDAWRFAVDFVKSLYALTRRFPREELFALTMQTRRAAVSIPANVAEGASRASGKDQARFFEIAFGSLSEVATLLRIAHDQEWVTPEEFAELRKSIARLARMLSGLKRKAAASAP